MMTKRDPYVNILRTTIATFSAGVGGADAVLVLPFTAALGLPDRFARRIARNIQLLLLEESNVAKVGDPTAGSGAIEDLTEKLCRTAWTQFQEIEASGGAGAALEAGIIQQRIAAVRAEREAAAARRKDSLTGTSDFPNLAETPVAVLDVPPAAAKAQSVSITFPALPRIRLAEPFERCATPPTAHWHRPARARKSFSPISARPPNSRRARPSRKTSSRPAASRQSPTTASRAKTR